MTNCYDKCLFVGDTFLSLEDQFDESENSFFPLTVVRIYSAYLYKRHTQGPMGMGWLLDFWYGILVHSWFALASFQPKSTFVSVFKGTAY